MALRFVEHPNVRFLGAPLVSVLCQVRFHPIYALLTAPGIVGFQEAIRDRYPKNSKEVTTEIAVGGGKFALNEKVPIWRFSDDDGWNVSLAVDFIALETASYTRSTEFIERFNCILEALARTVSPADSVRVGLRKINNLSHPAVQRPADWAGLLRPSLVGLLAEEGDFPGTFGRALGELEIRDSDSTLMIRHGLPMEDDMKFLLDMDYFTERPVEVKASGDLISILNEYSAGMTSFFHWAVLRPMYEHLRPVESA